jgi:hypothetical protein
MWAAQPSAAGALLVDALRYRYPFTESGASVET